MHELSIVINVIKQIEQYKIENDISKIDKLVLQIGELSGIVPKYIEDVYPIAIEQSSLKDMNLGIEVTPGIGKCTECDFVYNLVANNNKCPLCDHDKFSIISGKDFMIKEIHVK